MRCFAGKRWKQFSLGTFFVLLSLLCAFLAWRSTLGHEQRDAVVAIRRSGGNVAYRGEVWYDFRRGGWMPIWLKNLLGRDHFDAVTIVWLFGDKFRDSDLACLEDLPDVEEIWIKAPTGDAALVHLRGMTKLEEVNLFDPGFTDGALDHLSRVTKLKEVDLNGPGFTDAGLRKLRGLSELRSFTSRDARFTDDGLRELARHPKLATLHLCSDDYQLPITDAGIQHLHKLKKLTDLILETSNLSDEAVEELQRALPQCDVAIHSALDDE